MASKKLFDLLFENGQGNPKCYVEEEDGELISVFLAATHWDPRGYDSEGCVMLVGTTVLADRPFKWSTKITKGEWKKARVDGHTVKVHEDYEGDPLTLHFYWEEPVDLKHM